MQNHNLTLARLNQLVEAWQELGADKTFGGMNLTEFKAKVQPSLDARNDIRDAGTKMTDATTRRQIGDGETLRLIQLVVNSIKGDPTVGDDSALYEAAGYVRRSERKSGLHRNKQRTAQSPAKPV